MRTPLFMLAALAVCSIALADDIKVGKRAKVFTGPEGEKVTIIPVETAKKNEFLIKFEGVEGEWDDQVLLHRRTGGGDSEDYELKAKKGHYVSVSQRRGSLEAWPKGMNKGFNISYSKKDSEKAQPKLILSEFLEQEKARQKAAEIEEKENAE